MKFQGSALCMVAQCQGLLKWNGVIIAVINYTCVLTAFPTMTSVNEKHLLSPMLIANFDNISRSALILLTLAAILYTKVNHFVD